MRERLGEFIFDGESFEETYSGITVTVGRFVILEIDEGRIIVSSHVEHEHYNDVPITPATAREMAAQLLKMAGEVEG